MRDEDIKRVFEKIKAPDSSVEQLKCHIENIGTKSRFHFGRYGAIAAACLLIAVFAVSEASASQSLIGKCKDMFMEYFYGKEEAAVESKVTEKPDASSAKRAVEANTDGHIRTGRTYDYDLVVYNTLSNISEESGTRMGCMYYSIKYANPESEYILVMDDAATGCQRYFSKDGEMTKEELQNSSYKKCVEMNIDVGIADVSQIDFYYNEQQSKGGKYYFAVRWYLKETDVEGVNSGDCISLNLFDYAFNFDKDDAFVFSNLDREESHYEGNHVWYHYHTNMQEKAFELPDGYTLRVNAFGAYICKTVKERKTVLRKEYKSRDNGREKNYLRQIEKFRSQVKLRYNGKLYALSELAPYELDGLYLNAASVEDRISFNGERTSAKGYRWISAASFFENPIDIDKLEGAQ